MSAKSGYVTLNSEEKSGLKRPVSLISNDSSQNISPLIADDNITSTGVAINMENGENVQPELRNFVCRKETDQISEVNITTYNNDVSEPTSLQNGQNETSSSIKDENEKDGCSDNKTCPSALNEGMLGNNACTSVTATSCLDSNLAQPMTNIPHSTINCDGYKTSEEMTINEELNTRELSQVPYQYKPILVQYGDFDDGTGQQFGLIRGHHREMYHTSSDTVRCCSCCHINQPLHFIKRRLFTMQIMSVFLGGLLVFIGLGIILVTFVLLSDDARKYFLNAIAIRHNHSHIFAILGLTLLTLGTAAVSLALLIPVCLKRGRTSPWPYSPMFSCSAGDLYVKNAEKNYNLAKNHFLYFDAAFYAKLFGKNKIKEVQPDIKVEQ